eukprot:3466117-Alexandrium_andersonii.AAC.1
MCPFNDIVERLGINVGAHVAGVLIAYGRGGHRRAQLFMQPLNRHSVRSAQVSHGRVTTGAHHGQHGL